MFYGGPVEVIWHLASRLYNFPITHFVVGRDPAGVKVAGKDMYSPLAGQLTLKQCSLIKSVTILDFKPVALSKQTGQMEYIDPNSKKSDYYEISGSAVREAARTGKSLPDGFMYPKAWEVLTKYYGKKE